MTSTDATPKCRWCGQPWHVAQCPLVKALEFHPDGITVKRVEFWPTQLGPLPGNVVPIIGKKD